MKFITNGKNEEIINLDHIIKIEKCVATTDDKFHRIFFYYQTGLIYWNFLSEEDLDFCYDGLIRLIDPIVI